MTLVDNNLLELISCSSRIEVVCRDVTEIDRLAGAITCRITQGLVEVELDDVTHEIPGTEKRSVRVSYHNLLIH